MKTKKAKSYFLKTQRIGFLHWRKKDFPLALSLWGESAVSRYICKSGVFSQKEIKDKLQTEIANQKHHFVAYWPIFLLDSHEFIGLNNEIVSLNGLRNTFTNIQRANAVNIQLSSAQNLMSSEIYEELKTVYGSSIDSEILASYGTYATSRKVEFFAEGFAAIDTVPKTQKTQFMKDFESIFFDKYNRVLGGKKWSL